MSDRRRPEDILRDFTDQKPDYQEHFDMDMERDDRAAGLVAVILIGLLILWACVL